MSLLLALVSALLACPSGLVSKAQHYKIIIRQLRMLSTEEISFPGGELSPIGSPIPNGQP